MSDYWINAVEEALAQVDVELSAEKVEKMARVIANEASVYGEYSGEQAATRGAESDTERELRELKELAEEQRLFESQTIPCTSCEASGSMYNAWTMVIQCPTCNGEGRVKR